MELYGDKIDLFLKKHGADIIKKIIRLVNIKSVSIPSAVGKPYGEGCADALDLVVAMGKELGFKTETYDYHCCAMKHGQQKQHIGIFAHLDVMPETCDWSYNPFDAVVKNGYIIGRGTNDDKGPLIAALYTMLCIKELDISLRHGLRLVVGCNEENGMEDIEHYKKCEQTLPVFSIIPDAEFPVCFAEKGIISVTVKSPKLKGNVVRFSGGTADSMVPDIACCQLSGITFERACSLLHGSEIAITGKDGAIVLFSKGKSSHAAAPEGSVNAILLLCKGLLNSGLLSTNDNMIIGNIAHFLQGYYGEGLGIPFEDAISGKLTHICGTIRLTPEEEILLNFNVRFPVTANPEQLIEEIKKNMARCNFAVVETKISPIAYMDPRNPILLKMTEIYNMIAHDNAKPYVNGAATYARHLPNAVAFGPHFLNRGLPFDENRGKKHMPDECIQICDIMDSIKIYVLSLIEIDRMLAKD